MITQSQLEHELGKLAEEKMLIERWNEDHDTFTYQITPEGHKLITEQLQTDHKMRLSYFLIMVQMMVVNEQLPQDMAFMKAMAFFKKSIGVNIVTDLRLMNDELKMNDKELDILQAAYDLI